MIIDFQAPIAKGKTVEIQFFYSGKPRRQGGFGGFFFSKDQYGHDWIETTSEGIRAKTWRTNKEQWKVNVEKMTLYVTCPTGLVNVSYGRFGWK